VGGRAISEDEPFYVIGEIGIKHNASRNMAKKLIDSAIAIAIAGKCLTPASALATEDAVGSDPTCR
jgi:sialic acid synthase SpsE